MKCIVLNCGMLCMADYNVGDCLLPKCVNVMTLTATVTKETLSCVVERLSMKDPEIIRLLPNHENVKFVLKPSITKNLTN